MGSENSMHTLSKSVAASALFATSPRLMLPTVIILMSATWWWYWSLPLGPDIWAVGAEMAIGAVLGILLGTRHALSGHTRPIRAALGVAWRTGALWILVAAVTEYLVTDLTVTYPPVLFAGIFLLIAIVSWMAFLVSHYAVNVATGVARSIEAFERFFSRYDHTVRAVKAFAQILIFILATLTYFGLGPNSQIDKPGKAPISSIGLLEPAAYRMHNMHVYGR